VRQVREYRMNKAQTTAAFLLIESSFLL